MTAEFVLDSSLTMAWCFEDEASPGTDEIQDWLTADGRAYVPTLWHLEIAYALWACERRKRITG
jgi:predicted nucleic acid-binding protein